MNIRGISSNEVKPISPIYPISKDPQREDPSKQPADQRKYSPKQETKSTNDIDPNRHIDIIA